MKLIKLFDVSELSLPAFIIEDMVNDELADYRYATWVTRWNCSENVRHVSDVLRKLGVGEDEEVMINWGNRV